MKWHYYIIHREQSNKHDNEFHDKATDSIINYETVKYFTGEEFEIDRFKGSVIQYQRFNSSTQLLLGLLNITQQVFIHTLVHLYIPTVHTYIHTYTNTLMDPQPFKYTYIQMRLGHN